MAKFKIPAIIVESVNCINCTLGIILGVPTDCKIPKESGDTIVCDLEFYFPETADGLFKKVTVKATVETEIRSEVVDGTTRRWRTVCLQAISFKGTSRFFDKQGLLPQASRALVSRLERSGTTVNCTEDDGEVTFVMHKQIDVEKLKWVDAP